MQSTEMPPPQPPSFPSPHGPGLLLLSQHLLCLSRGLRQQAGAFMLPPHWGLLGSLGLDHTLCSYKRNSIHSITAKFSCDPPVPSSQFQIPLPLSPGSVNTGGPRQ